LKKNNDMITQLIRNVCYNMPDKINTTNQDFLHFLKQVNYGDTIYVNKNNKWIVGNISGFNHAMVYVKFNKIISEYPWHKIKYIQKYVPIKIINDEEMKELNTKSNIFAIIITIIIFIATFVMGMVYSFIPLIFK